MIVFIVASNALLHVNVKRKVNKSILIIMNFNIMYSFASQYLPSFDVLTFPLLSL
jgi:hypothetical protein